MLKNYIEKELSQNYEKNTFKQYVKLAGVLDFYAPKSYAYTPQEFLRQVEAFEWEENGGYEVSSNLEELGSFLNDQFIANYIDTMIKQTTKNKYHKLLLESINKDPAKNFQLMKELGKITDDKLGGSKDTIVYVDFNDYKKSTDTGKIPANDLNTYLKFLEPFNEV